MATGNKPRQFFLRGGKVLPKGKSSKNDKNLNRLVTQRRLELRILQKVITIIVLLAKSYIMTGFSHDKSPEES